MVFAAFGYIPPVAGAFLQQGVDIAVIVNALRTLVAPAGPGRTPHTVPAPRIAEGH